MTFSQTYMEQTLAAQPADRAPAGRAVRGALRSRAATADARRAVERDRRRASRAALDAVAEPRRGPHPAPLPDLIEATLRTNYFQRGRRRRAQALPLLQARLAPGRRSCRSRGPLFEIFVYSPRVEGVHLRGGKVARGGIRWSDRREDFRTEVLGLMKAQMVKNAVIVPVGRQGRLRRQAPAGRRADREAPAGRGRRVLPDLHPRPARPHRQHRGAARSCRRPTWCATTATTPTWWSPPTRAPRPSPTSPTRSSAEYGFWLGDAFASGGSAGYDHKEMGITARGAWESVKRHFRELGNDIAERGLHRASASATCRATCSATACCCRRTSGCVAAFDHRHIFLDPDPDPATSFAERQRLFELPRSSWADYDRQADLGGRRRLPAQRQVDPALAAGARRARHRRREA